MTVLLLMCHIWSGDLTNCVPQKAPRYQEVQESWTACMAESDRRNRVINKNARDKLWPNYRQFFCWAIEAVPA